MNKTIEKDIVKGDFIHLFSFQMPTLWVGIFECN